MLLNSSNRAHYKFSPTHNTQLTILLCTLRQQSQHSHSLHSPIRYTNASRDIDVFTTSVVNSTKSISDPGYHLKLPHFTSYNNVQITWQTDKLTNVMCGSSQGGHAFLDIEVVNKLSSSDKCILKVIGEHTIDYDKPLIYDYIPSEVAQFCKDYSG